MNSFSAFKLFYDELIYKKSSYVSYAKIEDEMNSIKNAISEVRNYSKVDVKAYTANLKKQNKIIKDSLEEILKLNKPLMEYYFLMYKSRLDVCNDKISDLPLIISNSFYNDYRLDDKTALELELSNNTIPKYSSLDKKKMRELAGNTSSFEYFINLLKESPNARKYALFLEKANYILSLYPLYNENHYNYFNRVKKMVGNIHKMSEKLEEKAKKSDDYENISLKMRIVYRHKFNEWLYDVPALVDDYFDYLFKKKESDTEIRNHFNVANELSYKSYLEIINELKEEKERLDAAVSKEIFEPVSYIGDTYIIRFRELLINNYYDKRLYLKPLAHDVNSFVKVAIGLYGLASDLENRVLDYYLYLASHSRKLQRNNDVVSAIVANLYKLYNPFDSLDRFEALRKEFADMLHAESNEFKKEYNTILLGSRVEFDFKGPIPNINAIRVRLNERCKKFILENCLENLVNFDETGMYDTRNYELESLCDRLNFDEIKDLYENLKTIFNNFSGSAVIPQKFIATLIYDRLNYHDTNEAEKQEKLKVICQTYLKEDCLFI